MNKNYLWVLGIGLIILVLVMNKPEVPKEMKKMAGETAQITQTQTSSGYQKWISNSRRYTQEFTTPSGFTSSSVKLSIASYDGSLNNIIYVIIKNSLTGSVLSSGSSTVSFGVMNIPMSSVALSPSTKYYLAVYSNNNININVYNGDIYLNNYGYDSMDAGSTWSVSNVEPYFEIWGTSSCTLSCSGKVCGDNGCGGSCGTCSTGYTCSSGQCIQSSCPIDFNKFVSYSNAWVGCTSATC